MQEAEKQKLKEKIKLSQEQLSVKSSEVSKLQVQLNSQNSAMTAIDPGLDDPASPSISASPLKNSAPRSAVSQKGMVEMKRVNTK